MIRKTKADDKIGDLDVIIFEEYNESNFYILYYLFPLIEKLVIEILKKQNEVDIEFYLQGIFRTPKAILNIEINKQYFEQNEIDNINEIFDENGIRNKILHYNPKNDGLEISQDFIIMTKRLSLSLIEKYCGLLYSEQKIGIDKIEHI